MVKVKKDLTGMRFGRLVVVNRAEDGGKPDGKKYPYWNCLCDCGNMKRIRGSSLTSGFTISCGCFRQEISKETMSKQNAFDISGDYGIGYTSKGEEFYFDLEDYDKIKEICWNIDAYGYVSASGRKGKMHRLVLNAPKDTDVDHINHRKNDNRKQNLRICTHADNSKNMGVRKNNKYGVTGVTWSNKDNKWYANITENGNNHYLGSFDVFEDAVKARKEAEEKYFGEFAYDYSQQLNTKKGV